MRGHCRKGESLLPVPFQHAMCHCSTSTMLCERRFCSAWHGMACSNLSPSRHYLSLFKEWACNSFARSLQILLLVSFPHAMYHYPPQLCTVKDGSVPHGMAWHAPATVAMCFLFFAGDWVPPRVVKQAYSLLKRGFPCLFYFTSISLPA